MRYKATISYHGKAFDGWQIQAKGKTVQGELEHALKTIWHRDIRVIGAGRTDAGVHAKEQVCHFDLNRDEKKELFPFKRSLNGLTSKYISVLNLEVVGDEFHARHSPHRKTYVYSFDLRDDPDPLALDFSYHRRSDDLNIKDMECFLESIQGEHDFASFCSIQNSTDTTIRTIHKTKLRLKEKKMELFVEGKGFLQHMVRIIAGTMFGIGRGELKLESVLNVLGKSGLRDQLGKTLPAYGLCLSKTIYLDIHE